MTRNTIPFLWVLVSVLLLWTNSAYAERSVAEIYEDHSNMIIQLMEDQNKLIRNQAKIAAMVGAHEQTIKELKLKLSDANHKATVAEELVKALRTDSFNMKARMTQIEGNQREAAKEASKGWFK